MKILILGSSGFIGSNLVSFLSVDNEIFGCDLSNGLIPNSRFWNLNSGKQSVAEIFSEIRFDLCVNAAGSGNVSLSNVNPSFDFESNVKYTFEVLDAIRVYQKDCRYIHISSAAVYGNPKVLPIRETNSIEPISPYGFHKNISEILCSEFNKLFKLNIAIIRPFSVFGIGLKKQLLWDLCNSSVISDSAEISVFGTGRESRDFIHISDLCVAIKKIIDNSKFNCEVYNCGSGKEIMINSVVDVFSRKFPKNRYVFTGESRLGDPTNWSADISKLLELGFNPRADFNYELIRYIDWFLKSYGKNK